MNQRRQWTDHEGAEQRSLFDWAHLVRLDGQTEDDGNGVVRTLTLGELLLWVPNGIGKLSPQVAAKMRSQGLQAGVPDLFLPLPVGRWHGLWIELKAPAPHSARITPLQLVWLRRLQRQGYAATVAFGWRAAADVITEYLSGAWGTAEL